MGNACTIKVQSRCIETKALKLECEDNEFMVQGIFGTGPMGSNQGQSGNQDPVEPFLWSKLLNRAFQQGIKNPANTQGIAFMGNSLFSLQLVFYIDWT